MTKGAYKFQERIYEDWIDTTDEELKEISSFDLAQLIDYGKNQDTHDGYIEYRIIDDTGKWAWGMRHPYNSVCIDLAKDADWWLDDIRQDYKLEPEEFAAACEVWLATYRKEIEENENE